MTYDANGNITTLKRYGKTTSGYGVMDNLSISYTGNQPTSVSESASDYNVSGSFEYKKANGSGYMFNTNGSLVADKSRGIAYITYDYNNNPKQIYFTNGSVTKYVYSASGQKLRVVHYTAKPNISRTWGVKPAELTMAQILLADSTDYLMGGSLTMKNGRIDKFLFGGGYAQASVASSTTDNFAFYYYNQDHLGNIREVVNASGSVQQVTNYYPFGAPYAESTAADFQPYKYNGKELDKMHGLNTYDYGARQHDPILGRWDRIDPLCEKYYSLSPYNYCGNSPIYNIDPDGRDYGVSVDSINNTITIKAKYYARSNSYESAQDAVDMINSQSGIFSYEVEGKSYTVNFALEAIDINSNEIADLNMTIMNDNTGYSNTYEVRSDDDPKFSSNPNLNGTTAGGKSVFIKNSRINTETGAHEIGHTLGLLHNTSGLMTAESSSISRNAFLQKSDVKAMIGYPIRGKVNGDAGKGIMISPVNRTFVKGKVSTISKK